MTNVPLKVITLEITNCQKDRFEDIIDKINDAKRQLSKEVIDETTKATMEHLIKVGLSLAKAEQAFQHQIPDLQPLLAKIELLMETDLSNKANYAKMQIFEKELKGHFEDFERPYDGYQEATGSTQQRIELLQQSSSESKEQNIEALHLLRSLLGIVKLQIEESLQRVAKAYMMFHFMSPTDETLKQKGDGVKEMKNEAMDAMDKFVASLDDYFVKASSVNVLDWIVMRLILYLNNQPDCFSSN